MASEPTGRPQLAQKCEPQGTGAPQSQVVGAQRARDQQTLAAYRAQLNTQVRSEMASQSAKIHADTQAKLQTRRNEVSQQVSSQLQGLRPAAVPSNLPAATRDRLTGCW